MTDRAADAAHLHPPSGTASGSATANHQAVHFVRHLVEMLLAMTAGMVFLGELWKQIAAALGGAEAFARPDVAAVVMATDMTAGMAVWMRHRGHPWASVAEMAAAMYVPFLVLLPMYWAGRLPGDVLLLAGHVAMVPATVVAMLRRREEYTAHPARRSGQGPRAGAAGRSSADTSTGTRARRVLSALRHRWPTWLALLVTVDNWVEPGVPHPWLLLILPAGYLVIGSARKRLGDVRVLAVQVGGFLGYLALTLVALRVQEDAARYLVAAGWLSHSVWDLAHYRANKVVPRGYAEWCGVVDAVIGLTIIFMM
jgi:hypothetical protein